MAEKAILFPGADAFAELVNDDISKLSIDDKQIWYKLLTLSAKATGGKPAKKFLDETKALLKEVGAEKFKKQLNAWLSFLITLKNVDLEYTYTSGKRTYSYIVTQYIDADSTNTIKGLVWVCSHFHDALTIRNVADLAERCYKKIPDKGPAAAALGNACLYTLYKSKGLDGIGQLSRLKLRIKQGGTQTLIDRYLLAAAAEQGVSIHQIEDLAVDDYGLSNGKKEVQFDEYTAVLEILAVGKSELKWFKPDGTEQKTVPQVVKEKHAAKLKKLKDSQKQIDQNTTAQRDRIDRMFRANRTWNWEEFSAHYLDHGLVSFLSKKTIWNFKQNEEAHSVIYINGDWVTNDGNVVKPSAEIEISLWHPATSSVNGIKEWREFLVANEIQQPLKQAYREVYLLTEAELRTKTYSNRMAAHVLKQYQFNVLAKTRGWKYALLGAFDNGIYNDKARLSIPEHGLLIEYWINEINDEEAISDNGIWSYVATDQIRFLNSETEQPIDLIDIPPVPFSEVLRDVDLFVGVASVGNDPAWRDNGGLTGYRDYWQAYSFGDLSEMAKNRKEILTGLIPRLKIRDIAEIRDKFLVVKGKLRTYKIHIGSTNILMEPNDQYLCIVPDRSQKSQTDNMFIPFEGDAGLSVVLSKAFLLADDDKITDPTITSQIRMR